jgi:aminopeptidase N
VFKITLEVPSETIALSNMPATEEKINGPTKIVYFQESPIMSTYLVAVIVGIFDYVEDFTTDGTVTSATLTSNFLSFILWPFMPKKLTCSPFLCRN